MVNNLVRDPVSNFQYYYRSPAAELDREIDRQISLQEEVFRDGNFREKANLIIGQLSPMITPLALAGYIAFGLHPESEIGELLKWGGAATVGIAGTGLGSLITLYSGIGIYSAINLKRKREERK